jgi:hypothetical protein
VYGSAAQKVGTLSGFPVQSTSSQANDWYRKLTEPVILHNRASPGLREMGSKSEVQYREREGGVRPWFGRSAGPSLDHRLTPAREKYKGRTGLSDDNAGRTTMWLPHFTVIR